MIFTKFSLKCFLIFLVCLSYFVGFFLRENAVGGGEADFYTHTWPLIKSFKEDFIYTINNYGLFNEASYPLSHILNAYLNPFSNTALSLQFSVTSISFFIFIFFGLAMKKIFEEINFIDIFLTSSIILILPFFRTSAFWGLTENFGWLFLIVAFYFFIKFKNNINKNPDINDIKHVIFFCLASACGVYARQTLIFLPISYLLFLFFNKANKKIFISTLVSYAIFSIPGFLLIFTWGGLYDVNNNSAYTEGYFSYKNILKNIPIITSLFAFYLLPVLFIEILNQGIKNSFQKYLRVFVLISFFYIALSQTDLLDYLGQYTLSGGVILKTNYLFQEQNYYLLLLFSSLGFSILFRIISEDYTNNIIMLIPALLICCFPKLLYQEYVEPLILIIFFLALKTQLHTVYFKKILTSNIVTLSYFSIFLAGTIYSKHFAQLS